MTKYMNRVTALLCAMLLTLSALSGCSFQGKKMRTVDINVATGGGFGNFTTVMMLEKGLLEKYLPEDVKVEWHHINSGNEQRDALITGQLDISMLPVTAAAIAHQKGFPVVMLTSTGGSPLALYSNNPSITSISDMTPDMKISVVSIGTVPHAAFLAAVEKETGDASRFNDSMVIMSNADGVNALISETAGIDAVVVSFPTQLAAEQAENVHMVRDLSDMIIEYGNVLVACTGEEFTKENPDIVEAFLRAHDEVVRMLTEDRETCIEFILEMYENCDEETANSALDFLIASLDFNGEKYDKFMTFMYENGFFEKPVAPFAEMLHYERGGQ